MLDNMPYLKALLHYILRFLLYTVTNTFKIIISMLSIT